MDESFSKTGLDMAFTQDAPFYPLLKIESTCLNSICFSKGIVSPLMIKLKCPHERREGCSLESNGMGSPEMEKIELRITCIGSKMIGYKFLHGFLSSLFPLKIDSL